MKKNKTPKLELTLNEHFVASVHYYKNEIKHEEYEKISIELQNKIKQILIDVVRRLVDECKKCAPVGHGTCARWQSCLEALIKKERL